jgi:hypothetical protein
VDQRFFVMRSGPAEQRAIDIEQHERPSRSHFTMVLMLLRRMLTHGDSD